VPKQRKEKRADLVTGPLNSLNFGVGSNTSPNTTTSGHSANGDDDGDDGDHDGAGAGRGDLPRRACSPQYS